MICGILLLGIALVTVMVSLILKVDKLTENEKRKKILSNVKVTAEKVEIVGNGNFYKKGPKYDKLVVSDFKVKVRQQGDKIEYVYRLCNDNIEAVKINDISIGKIACKDHNGNEMDCGNVKIKKYFMNEDEIVKDVLFDGNTCLNTVISVEYIGENLKDDLLVKVDQFSFNIDVIN